MEIGQQTLFYCLAQFDNMHIHALHIYIVIILCSTTYIHLSTYSTALEEEGHSALVLYNMTCTLYIHVKHAEMFLANAIFKLHENS